MKNNHTPSREQNEERLKILSAKFESNHMLRVGLISASITHSKTENRKILNFRHC